MSTPTGDHRTTAQHRRAPPRRSSTEAGTERLLLCAAAWLVGILFVFPVLWMVLTSFHSETDAATNPPSFFAPLSSTATDFFDSNPWPSC